jgi:alpha-D-xyloside xylohydrolase
VRPGAVLATGAREDRPDYDYADGVTLNAYHLADGARRTVTVPSPDGGAGAVLEVSRTGDPDSARRVAGAPVRWSLRLHGGPQTSDGPRVTAEPGTDDIEITL